MAKFMSKLLLFLFLVLLFVSPLAFAWDDCPYGKVNDTYPGLCSRYVDTDNNGVCDHSEPAPDERVVSLATTSDSEDIISGKDLKEKTVAEVAELYGVDPTEYAKALSNFYGVSINSDDSFAILHDNFGVEPSVAKDVALSLKEGVEVHVSKESKPEKSYNFFGVVTITLLLYFISYLLTRKGVIRVVDHRKIWNVVLLFSFLVSGLLGVLLVLRISYGIIIPFRFSAVYWHVEAGIVMVVISIFHILWHWRYFKSLFR